MARLHRLKAGGNSRPAEAGLRVRAHRPASGDEGCDEDTSDFLRPFMSDVRPHDRRRMTRGRKSCAAPFPCGTRIRCSMPVLTGASSGPKTVGAVRR